MMDRGKGKMEEYFLNSPYKQQSHEGDILYTLYMIINIISTEAPGKKILINFPK